MGLGSWKGRSCCSLEGPNAQLALRVNAFLGQCGERGGWAAGGDAATAAGGRVLTARPPLPESPGGREVLPGLGQVASEIFA